MQSSAADVPAYLGGVAQPRRTVLTAVRQLCLEHLAGFEESMRYGMPTYLRDGTAEVAWASQKQHLSSYILRIDVMDAHRDQLGGVDCGKGCIGYRRPEQIDLDVVRSMLDATRTSPGPVC